MQSTTQSPISFLRLPAVKVRTGLSRASIYAKIAAGEFPAPISLGARAVGWIDNDISTWMAARIAASRSSTSTHTAMPLEAHK
jgi:prophage regulatory protein